MRIFWIVLALCLSVGHVQGMEEDKVGKVQRLARRYVRPVVIKTLDDYSAEKQNLGTELVQFKFELSSPTFVDKLNVDIIQFLKEGTDPTYLGCSYSFKGIKEALAKNGITLAQDSTILEKRPINTKEIPLDTFAETPLLTKRQPSPSSSWCCFL